MNNVTPLLLQPINVPSISAGGHYSSAIVAGGFVFTSGQTPRDASRRVIGDTIEAQTEATLDNLARVLEEAGTSLSNIVKVTVYLTDLKLFPRFNATYGAKFSDLKPARTTVECGLQGVLIEIDAVAYVGHSEHRQASTLANQ